jgi:DNA-binding CsgD family transcriptional regulator
MAGRRCEVTDIRELLRRIRVGDPDRRIARKLDVSRNSVARYRRWARVRD